MSGPQSAMEVRHASLERSTRPSIDPSSLSDRARISAVLQAAALLSHLETAGWRLVSAWRDLSFEESGVLKGARVEPGTDSAAASQRLASWVEILFGVRNRIIGKGQAKSLAARFLRRCHRSQGRLPANRMVTQLLDEADFLWQPKFSPGRRALIAEIRTERCRRLLVAGRGAFERRLLAHGESRGALEELVARPSAGRLWRTSRSDRARQIPSESRLDQARYLHLQSRWQESIDTLEGVPEPAARILRAEGLRRLGRLSSASKLLESRSGTTDLAPEESLEYAQVSVSLYLDQGKPHLARSVLAQHRLGMPREVRMGFDLLAAEVSAHCGDWQAVGRNLSSLEELREDPLRAWRWNRLWMGWSRARFRFREAETFAAKALARGRRLIARYDVAALWRTVSSIRLATGDLVGAEKAARHALRLFETIDESAAMHTSRWLAELRLRQGRPRGVDSLLQSEIGVQRGPGPVKGPGPGELRARMALTGGRPSRALDHLESLLRDPPQPVSEAGQRPRVLAARALGWLGRGAEARDLLTGASQLCPGHLEPEELPALWALAGDWSRARQSAPDDTAGRLWRSALGGEPISPESWEGLSSLGAYRSARMVFDFQVVVPGRVPRHWIEKAAVTLRCVGAHSFAERLDRTREGSWKALETFLKSSTGRDRDLGELFATAGYFDTRLEWRRRGTVQVLVPGRGGERVLTAEKRGGELVLSAATMDPVVRALFALAVREFEPELGPVGRVTTRVQGILGESDALLKALVRLERLAGSDVPVLIEGETGTGKELAARQMHRLSARSSRPLISVNCAALSETLLLSDLFGHVRGAFTGADRDRAGVFEAALGGTVFLDEIGDLPLAAQGKLLRVLQEGEVRRVGESVPRQIDIRVVAATHRDLPSMVEQRSFRSDLFFRLKVGSLTLPPLRARERDVLVLADHFMGSSGRSLTSRARQKLLAHHWPGNVRELRSVLQVAVALSERSIIDAGDLELPDRLTRRPVGYHQQVEEFRRELVRQALAASGGQQSAAARRLDVSRQALSYLVRRLGLQ